MFPVIIPENRKYRNGKTDFRAETTLTMDTVPVDVDAAPFADFTAFP